MPAYPDLIPLLLPEANEELHERARRVSSFVRLLVSDIGAVSSPSARPCCIGCGDKLIGNVWTEIRIHRNSWSPPVEFGGSGT